MKTLYEARLAPLVADLSQVVVSLGLLSVSIGYVSAVLDAPQVVSDPNFWIRVAMLLATVGFTSYYLLAYVVEIDQDEGDTIWAAGSMSPVRIIVLFLLDLLMLAEQGWMYGILVLRDVGDFGTASEGSGLAMSATHFLLLAAFAASWHLSAFCWHRMARSRRPSLSVHLGFFAGFLLLAGVAAIDGLVTGVLAQALWVLGFVGLVAALFFGRARLLIRNALRSHERRQGT